MLGDTTNLLEDAVSKLDEIQLGPAVTFDAGEGEFPGGKKQLKIKLEKDEMTIEEFSEYINSNEEATIKLELTFYAYRENYKVDESIWLKDQDGTPINDITTITKDTVLYVQWTSTGDEGYDTITTVHFNGGVLTTRRRPSDGHFLSNYFI